MEPQGGQEPRSEGSGYSAQPEQPGSWPPPPVQQPQYPPQYPPAGAGWPPPDGPGGTNLPGGPGVFPGPGAFPGPGGPPPWGVPGGPGGPPQWGVPGGPGGPPPWGGPPQYGFGPPPQRKQNTGLVLGLVGGGVLLVLLVVVGAVAAIGSIDDDPKTTSGKVAAQAGSSLGGSPGLTFTGTYAGGRASFSVTKAGTARGSYTADGGQVGRVDIGGTTYLKAGKDFWGAQGISSTRADRADGTWTKAPEPVVELNLSDLSPARLAQVLRQAGNDPLAVKVPVNGAPTIKMSVGGRTYYIATKGSHRLVRIEDKAGPNRYSFDVTTLSGPAMAPVFTALRADVRALTNAYDPAVTVTPVSKLRFGSCNELGCTVSANVRPIVEESAGSIGMSMNVRFRGTGGTVSTCSDTAMTRAGRARTLSCRTSGGAWSSWYRSHNGRFMIHASVRFAATVNSAGDVNALLQKLSQEQQGG